MSGAARLQESDAYERGTRVGEARLRALVENVSDLIVLVDAQGIIRYITPSCERISGYSPAEIVGRSMLDFVLADDLRKMTDELAFIVGHSSLLRQTELRFPHKDGSVRVVQGLSRNLIDDPHVRGIVITARDVTVERNRAAEHERLGAQLREALEETIETVAAALEARDPYTAGHQQRVARLAAAIGEALGLSDDRLHGLLLAASIHDIGKISVPAEILSTPRRLTPAEYELIKSHPAAGYEIIKGVNFPWPIAQIVLQHHEQFDGSGYPRGLKGEAILLEARIIAVADTVEAMTSHRPYRPGLGLEKALEEITAKRGTSYDPAVVDACLQVFRNKGFRFDV